MFQIFLANLVSVALLGKVGVKVSSESDKIVMTKTMSLWEKVFVIKDYLSSVFLKL